MHSQEEIFRGRFKSITGFQAWNLFNVFGKPDLEIGNFSTKNFFQNFMDKPWYGWIDANQMFTCESNDSLVARVVHLGLHQCDTLPRRAQTGCTRLESTIYILVEEPDLSRRGEDPTLLKHGQQTQLVRVMRAHRREGRRICRKQVGPSTSRTPCRETRGQRRVALQPLHSFSQPVPIAIAKNTRIRRRKLVRDRLATPPACRVAHLFLGVGGKDSSFYVTPSLPVRP